MQTGVCMKDRTILSIDLKSFFASCECINRGLDPFKTPLVVSDISRGNGAITLAVTPYLKTFGVPSRGRVFELPKNIKIITIIFLVEYSLFWYVFSHINFIPFL